MTVTAAQLTAGFRGSFYLNGQKWAGAQGWMLMRETTITEEGTLDMKINVPVEQSLAYQLKITELIVDSSFSALVLASDQAQTQLRFLFIGESRRNDGQVERIKMDGACISAEMMLGGIERGAVRKRDITFKLDVVPSFDSQIAA